jgi:tripartite-type tricarboxylate transporter receptor subunit TctC
LLLVSPTISTNPTLLPNLPYKTPEAFASVAQVITYAMGVAVHAGSPIQNIPELVAYAKKNPGKLNFASSGNGSAPHLAGVAVEKATQAQWNYIPYKGGAQAIGDTVGGQTQILMNGMLATLPHVQSGKLKVLGVSKATRVPLLANVPTLAEQGVKDFESGTWQGLLVPANMPEAHVQRLAAELTRIIRSPEVRERLVSQGAEVYTMTPAELARFFEQERKKWAGVVQAGNIRLD